MFTNVTLVHQDCLFEAHLCYQVASELVASLGEEELRQIRMKRESESEDEERSVGTMGDKARRMKDGMGGCQVGGEI